MINTPAKILLTLSAFSGVTAAVYGIASGDRSGALLFGAVMIGALLAALAVIASAGVDPLDPAEDDDAAAPVTYAPASVARPSPWPLMTALAVGLVAVGGAEGVAYVVAGGVLGLVVAGVWTAQVWREHPTWTPRLGERMGQRVMVPGLLPVVALLTTAVITISLSRILLAVSKNGSVVIAMVAALVIFAGCAFIAYRPHIGPGALLGLIAVAAVSVGSVGVFGAAAGEREFHPAEEEERVERALVAENTQFDKPRIDIPTGKEVRLDFENRDEGIYHNFAVYRPSGEPVYASRPIVEGELVFDLEIEQPGTYTFICDFHPDAMKGELVVG